MTWKNSVATMSLLMVSLFVPPTAFADSKAEIDTNVNQALTQFYAQHTKNKDLAEKAAASSSFPALPKEGWELQVNMVKGCYKSKA